MKLAIWLGFAFLLLVWTTLTWAVGGVATWAADAVASGAAVDWATVAGQVRLPAWLAWWIDPGLIEATIGAVVWALELTRDAMPWLASMAGWLVALLWLLWGVGALALLLVAGVLHLLVSSALAPSGRAPGTA